MPGRFRQCRRQAVRNQDVAAVGPQRDVRDRSADQAAMRHGDDVQPERFEIERALLVARDEAHTR